MSELGSREGWQAAACELVDNLARAETKDAGAAHLRDTNRKIAYAADLSQLIEALFRLSRQLESPGERELALQLARAYDDQWSKGPGPYLLGGLAALPILALLTLLLAGTGPAIVVAVVLLPVGAILWRIWLNAVASSAHRPVHVQVAPDDLEALPSLAERPARTP